MDSEEEVMQDQAEQQDTMDNLNGNVAAEENGDFDDRQMEAARELKQSPLGELMLPIMTALLSLAGQVGGTPTPDLETIKDLVKKAEKDIDAGGVTKQVMKGLYAAPVEQETIVQPPKASSFSKTDYFTPNNPVRTNLLKLYFPVIPFHGTSTDKISVEQFLNCMTTGVERMKGTLSEADFRSILLAKTTARAHESLTLWLMDKNLTLASLYAKFLGTFDNKESPSEAREKLEALSSQYFSTLAAMLLRIEGLARRAALIVRGLANQTVLFNTFATETLERLIPEPYRATGHSMRVQMESGMNEALPFHAVASIYSKWERQISALLRKEYIPRERGKYKKFNTVQARVNTVNHKPAPNKVKASPEKHSNNGTRSKPRQVAEVNLSVPPPVVKSNWNSLEKNAGNSTDAYVTKGGGNCPKCKGKHSPDRCQNVAGPVARYSCRKCKLDMFHFERYCPFHGNGTDQKKENASS